MTTLLAPLALALLQAAPALPPSIAYRFDEAKRSVYCRPQGDPAKEVKVSKGESAASGDTVRTGWLGQAVLAVPERSVRFEVYADTEVRLAGGEPDVLLVVRHGRIKALFQALLEGRAQERRVAVPGALLAVRGTKYGVEVDRKGNSSLVVFEGVVEVLRPESGKEPVWVKAGEWAAFGPGMAPRVEPMGMRGFSERSWNQGMRPDGSMSPGSMSPGANMSKGMGGGSGSGRMPH